MVVSEFKKHILNRAKNENIFFWRNNTGHEVDIIIETSDGLLPVEIKSGKTITNEFFNGINYWRKLTGTQSGAVVFGGDDSQSYSDSRKAITWRDLHKLFKW